MSKISIRFFDDREVRAVWDETECTWRFSVLGNYWKYLKTKLKREDSEVVSATNQLRLLAPDGKNDRETFMKGIDYSYYYEQEE